MASVFFFIDQIALGLYIILGVIFLWYLRKWYINRSEYRSSNFELERDISRSHQRGTIFSIIFLAQVGLIILGIQYAVVPVLASEIEIQGIVSGQVRELDGAFNTPTPAPVAANLDLEPVEELGGDDAVLIIATPTFTPTPVGTIVPGAPASFGCDTPQAYLEVPTNGMKVINPIVVRGTAFTDNFAAAKIELQGPGTLNTYRIIEDIREPVTELRDFSQFVPAYAPGLYQFRLMVFDITDTLRASCMVNIYIAEPVATATPPPSR